MRTSPIALSALAAALWLPLPAGAQVSPAEPAPEPPLVVYAYAMRHQPAAEALPLVRPLLSRRGTVELQEGDNTLVVRDSRAAMGRIIPVLRSFDHPALALRLEILLVEAGPQAVSPPTTAALPAELLRGLRALFTYESYEVLARSSLESREGEQVTYDLGEEFRVAFRFGTVLASQRLRLHDFQVSRERAPAPAKALLHTNLNLWLERPFILGLTRGEGSGQALLVVLNCAVAAPAEKR